MKEYINKHIYGRDILKKDSSGYMRAIVSNRPSQNKKRKTRLNKTKGEK